MRISLLCSVASLFLASTAAFAQGEGEFRPQEDPSPSGGIFHFWPERGPRADGHSLESAQQRPSCIRSKLKDQPATGAA